MFAIAGGILLAAFVIFVALPILLLVGGFILSLGKKPA
jgi:hypothetical protein